MSRYQRDKGAREEIAVVHSLVKHGWIDAQRCIGQSRDGGADVVFGNNQYIAEVKVRGKTVSRADVERWWVHLHEDMMQRDPQPSWPLLVFRVNKQPAVCRVHTQMVLPIEVEGRVFTKELPWIEAPWQWVLETVLAARLNGLLEYAVAKRGLQMFAQEMRTQTGRRLSDS